MISISVLDLSMEIKLDNGLYLFISESAAGKTIKKQCMQTHTLFFRYRKSRQRKLFNQKAKALKALLL